MGKVIRPFCWHQTFVPWGLSVPAPGLYTCIKSWKQLFKIVLQRHFFKACNKWMKWQDIFVDIKTSPPGGCLFPAPGLHSCIKSWKSLDTIRPQRDYLNLQQMTEVTRYSCRHQNFVPKGFWLVVLRLNVPVNNFSVISGRSHRFLGN